MAINIPSRVINGDIISSVGVEFWPYDDGTGDPWWAGGGTPRDYRWSLEISIIPQTHSSHLTRDDYEFNGYDVRLGDWIASSTTGTTVQIVEVTSKTASSITVIVEDVVRYNTFRAPGATGNGSIGVGQCIIFELNEEGEPMVDPIPPAGVSAVFFSNLMSRFQNINEQFDFNLTQVGHTFQKGDIISVDSDSGNFVLSDNTFTTVIGQVTDVGPTPDQFFINPVQKIVNDFDTLPGAITDILYTDNAGGLTTSPSSGKMMYIKLRENTQSTAVGQVIDGTTTPGNVIEINGSPITISGAGDIPAAISAINLNTGVTGITADSVTAPTQVDTSLPLFYGEPALYTVPTPATATINGVTVTFDIDTVGLSTYALNLALEEDMAAAINRDMLAAGNTDIVATTNTNNLIISNNSGGAITISNGAVDQSGVAFAGNNSGSGVELLTPAGSGSYLRLTAPDARPIDIFDVAGTPSVDYGIYSAENGAKAAAIYVEQGLRTGGTTVVADIPSRDALNPFIGDQVMVLDKGNGEWELYLYDGSVYIPVANQDSARTDANSVDLIVDFNDPALQEIVTVSSQSRITLITVEVITPFDGSPTLTVGISPDLDLLFTDDLHDLSTVGSYAYQTDYYFDTGVDTDILVNYIANGATQGQARIIVSYM
jgi:hypothetical protein